MPPVSPVGGASSADPGEPVPVPPAGLSTPPPPNGGAPDRVPGTEIAAFQHRISRRLEADRPPVVPAAWVRLRGDDVVWLDPDGDPVLLVAAVAGEVDARALAAGDVVARDVSVMRPRLTIERAPAEPAQWTVSRAYSRLLGGDAVSDPASAPDDDDPSRIRIEGVEVTDGEVVIRHGGGSVNITGVQAAVDLVVVDDPDSPEPTVVVNTLAGTVEVPDEIRMEFTLRTGVFTFPDDSLTFDVARIESGGSVIESAVGRWAFDAPGPGVDARARASPVSFADLRFLAPELPESGEASFSVRVESEPDGRTTFDIAEIVAVSADPVSEVRGAASFALGGGRPFEVLAVDLLLDPLAVEYIQAFTGPLPYGGSVYGAIEGAADAVEIDVVARLTSPDLEAPFEVGISGTVGYSGDGPIVHGLRATLDDVPLAALRRLAPGLALRGTVTGIVLLSGPPARSPLDLDVRLALAEGTVDIAGTLDLTGAEPAYDFTGRVSDIVLQEVIATPLPPVSVHAAFALAGSGLDLATASATLSLDGRFTGWLAGPADALQARVMLAGGTLAVETATVSLSTLTATASGTWGLLNPSSGALRYTLAIDDLRPWGPYLPLV
ncbi:MAG TPA: hypothetical protein VNZ57_06190, partial [Longimicrobiales bacterium]|nr:hypothetical protein [Longimicrobiales bacterium]